LLTADNRLVAQQDSAPVYETYPTDQWKAGQYILDEHLIPIDATVPPGRYWLKVGLYTPESGERLIARDQAGRQVPDQSLPLIQVDVE
jgi:mannosyltransferase